MLKYCLFSAIFLLSIYSTSIVAMDCMSGNCENGKGVARYNEAQFVGDFKDGKPSGFGTYVWKDGTAYVGEFKNGLPNGRGEYLWPDGRKYVGEFQNGQPNGQGVLTTKDGETYKGTFQNGALVSGADPIQIEKFSKEGLASLPPVSDEIKGSSENPENTVPEKGCISGNCVNGRGTARYNDGEYTGDFKDKYFNGKGTYTWPDGSVYTGDFKDGRPHGKGTFTKPDGTQYTGDFKFGQPNGKGKLTDKDNKTYEGDFVNGALVKPKKKISDKKKQDDYIAKAKPKVKPVDQEAINPKSLQDEKDYYASQTPFWKKIASGIGDWFKGDDKDSSKTKPKKDSKPEKDNQKTSKSSSSFGNLSFLKSAIIPGWTQWDNGEKLKGGIFFSSFFLTAGVLYQWDKNYSSKKEDYNRSVDFFWFYPNDLGLVGVGYMGVKDNYSDFRKVGNEARMISWGLAAIYLVNVLDAIFFSKPVSTAFHKEEGFHFYTEQYRIDSQLSDSRYNLQYIWRF